jgi:DivIVA domain-containing protein
MGQILILLVVALVAAALVFGVVTLITGGDPGLEPAEPDGTAVPLPVSRPLTEVDLSTVRFDTAVRGYRMAQVDQALRRAAYDLGYKEELINVLEAEVTALREGRVEDAETLRKARENAARPPGLEDEALSDTAPADPAGVADPLVLRDGGTEVPAADDAVDSDSGSGAEPAPETAGPPAASNGRGGTGVGPDQPAVGVSVSRGPVAEKADAQQ